MEQEIKEATKVFVCIICCVFQDLLFASLLKLKNPLSSFSMTPVLSPMDPAMMSALAFWMGMLSLVSLSFLYGWFLDYKEANNTRMEMMERKMCDFKEHPVFYVDTQEEGSDGEE